MLKDKKPIAHQGKRKMMKMITCTYRTIRWILKMQLQVVMALELLTIKVREMLTIGKQKL